MEESELYDFEWEVDLEEGNPDMEDDEFILVETTEGPGVIHRAPQSQNDLTESEDDEWEDDIDLEDDTGQLTFCH